VAALSRIGARRLSGSSCLVGLGHGGVDRIDQGAAAGQMRGGLGGPD